jgi:cytochrome c
MPSRKPELRAAPRAVRRLLAAGCTGLGLGLALGPASAGAADPARADERQLAFDKGCYNCHGEPPRRQAPTFAQLAAASARWRDDAAAQARLADRLRSGGLLGHIDAHERLTPDEALRLVRWIAEGASAR